MTGRHLSNALSGTNHCDLYLTSRAGIRTWSERGLFLVTLFLAVEERVTGSHGCETKTSWMTVNAVNNLDKHGACSVHAVNALSLISFND